VPDLLERGRGAVDDRELHAAAGEEPPHRAAHQWVIVDEQHLVHEEAFDRLIRAVDETFSRSRAIGENESLSGSSAKFGGNVGAFRHAAPFWIGSDPDPGRNPAAAPA
jgi:hypothetical protein